jgi:hypothetical protein
VRSLPPPFVSHLFSELFQQLLGVRLVVGRLEVGGQALAGVRKHDVGHVADGGHGALNVQHDAGGQGGAGVAVSAGLLGCGLCRERRGVGGWGGIGA